jgi:protease IV
MIDTTSPTAPAPQVPSNDASGAAPPPPPVPAENSEASWERQSLERLATGLVRERQLARRWKNGLRLAWLFVFVLLIYTLFYRVGSMGAKNQLAEHVAVIEIKGEIAAGAEASAENIVDALRVAFEEPTAKAIVLQINSPGGSPVQAGIINDEIRRLKVKHKKPVYAVVEEACASAAYYIAVAADQIVVDKASIVGSIGVLMDGFGFNGLMEKLGVERRLMTAGKNKGFLDPFSPQSKAHSQYAQAMLDQIHQQFIDTVKLGRGTRLKETEDTFSGLFWSGQQAVVLGLADQLGTLDFVARELVKVEEVVDYTRRETTVERLAKRFGAAVGDGAVKALGQSAIQLR